MGKFIIVAGLLLVLVGVVVEFLAGGRGGFLPGDIVIRRGSTVFFFPIVSCVVVSLFLSLLFYLLFGARR